MVGEFGGEGWCIGDGEWDLEGVGGKFGGFFPFRCVLGFFGEGKVVFLVFLGVRTFGLLAKV